MATTERSTRDRPDDISGAQIHFVYAVPIGAEGRGYDIAGDFAVIADLMQEWLETQTGMTWRLDTYNGKLDVSFLPIRWEGAHDPSTIVDAFHNALGQQVRREPDSQKKYAVFFDYDGAQGAFPVEGVAGENVAITLISGPFHEHIAAIAIHEIIHTFGAVAPCAPNATPGKHVSDSHRDIMGGGSLIGGVLDWGKDDYFQHGRANCLDIADNPYWAPTPRELTAARNHSPIGGAHWSIQLRCGGLIR